MTAAMEEYWRTLKLPLRLHINVGTNSTTKRSLVIPLQCSSAEEKLGLVGRHVIRITLTSIDICSYNLRALANRIAERNF